MGGKTSTWYAADFETTSLKNLEKDGCVRVWLWSLVGVEFREIYYGTSIETFIAKIKALRCSKVFFHNLKFDGKFIVDYFIRSGYIYGDDFEVIIDGLGSWYEIKWKYGNKHSLRIWDSLKKFPNTSVKQLGKFLGLPKLDQPFFDRYYPNNYVPTDDEINYCIRDSEVIAKAIEYEISQGFKSMTLASDCFKFGKETCLNGRFYRDFFPLLDNDVDNFCRKAYRGGISYLKKEYEDKEIHNVKVYDVNSLYPSVMSDCVLPIGQGYKTTEKPDDDKLYFVKFKCQFYVKNKRFPFLQLRNSVKYLQNQFIEYSSGEEELYLTSVDYKNFKKNYKVLDEHDNEYLVFQGVKGLLKPHVDYWLARKIEYEQQGLPFMRYIAKTMMNGFYGKTALRTKRQNVIPKLDTEKDIITYSDKVVNEVEPVYIPYGAFVTAWARDKLINSSLAVWDNFIYCDTDSIHCFEMDNPPLDIHPTALGKWKDETKEGAYEYARYIKQKTYCHARPTLKDGKLFKEVVEIRCAGLNVNSRTGINIDDFKYGLEIKNANFKMKTVKGGCVLMPTDFKLESDDEKFERVMKLLEES